VDFCGSGLEALINVGGEKTSKQFRHRGRQLAAELQIDLTDNDLRIAYALRSKLVHAESFLYGLNSVLPTGQHDALYQKLESLLRLTIRRCLLDEAFGSDFRSDADVKARWGFSRQP
jgi:hypothetical protein